MTFGILHANRRRDRSLTPEQVEKLLMPYTFLGFFYEHRNNTAGFVFEQSELEIFVRKHHKDPAEVEGHGLKNLADDFAREAANGNLLIFPDYSISLYGGSLKDNYNRFGIYQRRETSH